jgi:hypothetical protein
MARIIILLVLLLSSCNLPAGTSTPPATQPAALVTVLPGPATATAGPKQPELPKPSATPAASPTIPAATATPASAGTPTSTPATIDRKSPAALIAAVRQALEKKDITPFRQLAAEQPGYTNYIEGGQPVEKARLLDDLQARLAGSATLLCDGYSTYETTLQIWTSGWTPEWQIDRLCYQDCQPVSPPYLSKKAAFFFNPNKTGEYELTTLWLADAKIFTDMYKVQMHSCSEAYIPPPAVIACPSAPATRLNVNGYAYADTQTATSNRVRSAPGTGANILGLLQPGKAVQITGGPQCVEGYVWWKVKALQGSLEGWTAEGQAKDYWLVPCGGPDNCAP